MRQDIVAVLYGKAYRFHQTVTGCGPVARVDINVPTPEAFWTVIGVAVPLDDSPALGTGEIFNMALEFFVHWC